MGGCYGTTARLPQLPGTEKPDSSEISPAVNMVMTHGTEKPELGWVREVDEEGRQAGPYSLQATAAVNRAGTSGLRSIWEVVQVSAYGKLT